MHYPGDRSAQRTVIDTRTMGPLEVEPGNAITKFG